MLKNFLKIAFRRFRRRNSSALINITGLAAGIACCMIIFLFIESETSWDSFHANRDRIYQVFQHSLVNGEVSFDAVTPVPMAGTLKAGYPEVVDAVRVCRAPDTYVISGNKYFRITNALYADSSFFGVFSFGLLRGDPSGALSSPRSVVLSESLAARIYGDRDPSGSLIRFENDPDYFTVTGICNDPPENSHIKYDLLISMDAFWDYGSGFWLRNNLYTYLLLRKGSDPAELEKKFPGMLEKYLGPQFQQALGFSMQDFMNKGNYLGYRLQPIGDIHLNTSVNQSLTPAFDRKYLSIFAMVGLFILLMAVINYVNLATARASARAMETGLRKAMGSSGARLAGLFLSEALLLSIIAALVALIMVPLVLPLLNRLTGLALSLSVISRLTLFSFLGGIALITGILAGSYPAFLQSSFGITSVLKGNHSPGSRSVLRNMLVMSEFFTGMLILSFTLVIYRQVRFMQSTEPGFDRENVLVIGHAESLGGHLGSFMEELRNYPVIAGISNSGAVPGVPNGDDAFSVEGRNLSESFVLQATWVDLSFIGTMGMKISSGRNFSGDYGADSLAVIINEAAVRKLNLKEPVGTILLKPDENGKITHYKVVGVAGDFHYQSFHNLVQPFIMFYKKGSGNWGGYLSIRLAKGDRGGAIKFIEGTWKRYMGERPLEYTFLDEDLAGMYIAEKRTAVLSAVFSLLAAFVAFLGLTGLILFTTEQRTRETGLRKIMGASAARIALMISFDTVRLVLFASLAALPVSWFLLGKWLSAFAYRVGPGPSVFIFTVIFFLCLSLLATGFRTWYAATRNPVDALRYE